MPVYAVTERVMNSVLPIPALSSNSTFHATRSR
jgi:hypothetical protein